MAGTPVATPASNGKGQTTAPANAQPLGEIGSTGLVRFNGLVYEEFLPELHGKKLIKIIQEMRDNDPVVGAELFVIDMLLRQVNWDVEKGGDTPNDEEAATFLEECMDDMSMTWPDVISEAATMFPFGWAMLEICYKKRSGPQPESSEDASSKYNDGRVGWRKMPIRAQESFFKWIIDDNGGLQGMVQRPAPDYQERAIPIEKALLFRTSTHKGNPEGRSIFRNAYRPWYFKKRIEEYEAIGIERDLAGFPMMHVDPRLMDVNASEADKALLKQYEEMVFNVRRDALEGMILPSLYDNNNNELYKFTLLNSGGQRQFDTDKIIGRYDQRIAMTVLADFILLGHENVGSFALSSDKTDLFAVAIGAWLEVIAAVFNNYAVPRLFAMNAWKLEKLPKIVPGDIETPDLAELATYITALANAGMPLFPNENLERYLLTVASLPEPAEGEIPEAVQPTPPGGNEQTSTQAESNAANLGTP